MIGAVRPPPDPRSRDAQPFPQHDDAPSSSGTRCQSGPGRSASSASSPSCPRRCRSPPTRSGPALRRKISLVGIIFGFFLASYTGVLLSATRATLLERRPPHGRALPGLGRVHWHGRHLAAALPERDSAGEGFKKVKRADRFAIVFEMAVLVLFLVLLGSAAAPLTSGHLAPLFWGGLVVLGLVIPLLVDILGGAPGARGDPGGAGPGRRVHSALRRGDDARLTPPHRSGRTRAPAGPLPLY